MESNNLMSKDKIRQIKSADKYENIKSDYFLQLLFSYLEKKKLLNIVKYNKNIKKRININNNNYKEYIEKYSSIELEIKPTNFKYCKFINIKKEDEIYYHIYLNNNKEEIKRGNINIDEEFKMIKIIIDYQIQSFKGLFENCKLIESIYFKKFYRNNITDMSYMFSGCSSLKELNIYNFNTTNVTNMGYMFEKCSSIKELNLNSFNINNIIDMRFMFFECSSLENLNISNFNNNKIKYIRFMFSGCSSLKKLDLSGFITNNVHDMSFMFDRCRSIKELNIKNFNTNNVTNMCAMFYDCSSLKELNFNNFIINKAIYLIGMLYGCTNELIIKIKTQCKNINEDAFKKID